MQCSWDDALTSNLADLPSDVLDIIRNGSNDVYLSALARVTLDPRFTDRLLAHCENLFAHFCASLQQHGSGPAVISSLGRIIPFAPYLSPYAEDILRQGSLTLDAWTGSEELTMYLLGLLRLLRYDHRTFVEYIDVRSVTKLLEDSVRANRYLAVRILQICLNGADKWFEQMVARYLGEDSPQNPIDGPWDGKIIDYRFLTLWEEHRHNEITTLRYEAKSAPQPAKPVRLILTNEFHPSTTLIGEVLFPRNTSKSPQNMYQNLVHTTTTAQNLKQIAKALKDQEPLMLSGLEGAGKTALIHHVAGKLGKLEGLVNLHLNEQSDAKLLVGVYTTGNTPGSFVWKPGVLTTAVQEGRWILIEDLDRAPDHIISSLLPLIEHGRLPIPSRKQTIHAKQGFRIIATVRTRPNHRGEKARVLSHMLGRRHFQDVIIDTPTLSEYREIASQLYPPLAPLLPQFIAVYERLLNIRQSAVLAGQNKTGALRTISSRDLLKWCARVARLLTQGRKMTANDMDHIFLEAVDCFVGSMPAGPARNESTATIAEVLHIDPQRQEFLSSERTVRYNSEKAKVAVGRYTLDKAHTSKRSSESSFSMNSHTTRMLERVAAAVVNREPLLLVGETGVGKTTAVQHLAEQLGTRLVPFNLSQQSEAGDLLGGFKPVSARTLVTPIKDEFDELFSANFSRSRNQQFLELLGKNTARGNWKAVCKLWRQALIMVEQQSAPSARSSEAPSKKRKVDSPKPFDHARWTAFAESVQDLERRLSHGNEGFAFAFIEGNIVKAVRNGDWVLLDEINLASPDTLEALADLLDTENPSLLLTEAGNIERVSAHPNFRIFAAMNPATDVGKKDLMSGIRSRFTEVYVESPDKDIKSLQSIIQSYLGREIVSDQSVTLDVGVLYQKIITLVEQNKLVDGTGQKPHFSLRTLTRTLSYAKFIAPHCTMRRALYEGFQMSFLTFLDLESTKVVQPLLEHHIFRKRSNLRAELEKAVRRPTDSVEYVKAYPQSKHWLRKGPFDLLEETHYIITPFILTNLENLVRAASTGKFPVLIQGPTSSGKTSMIEYLAKRTGHKFVRINNHEHTDLQEYLGTYVSGPDGKLQFQEGVLVKAVREGHWVVLDELNLAPTDVLEALNRLLDDNRELFIPETQETVRPHRNFMLFATQNPAGLYGGRKTLSRAFRNRFLELHFDDIPVDELQEILHKRTQLPESRCKRIVSVYRELSVLRQENRIFEQKSFATLRDLFRWALRTNDNIQQLAANGFMLLGERARKAEEREMVRHVIERVLSEHGPRVRIDDATIYSPDAEEIRDGAKQAARRGIVWTKAMRRLYLLVSRAVQNNEPVLLVGETGCGKTTVCQVLADAMGQDLHIINAHQNTETGDLIGSQRPIRNRAVIEAQVRDRILMSSLLKELATASAHSTDALIAAYRQAFHALPSDAQNSYADSSAHHEVQASLSRYKALFEWVDGSLVEAMKTGSPFLLDEISLADDSVLERLNSVLEPSRSILLAEKGSLDSFVRAQEGFYFFATMNPGGDYSKRELSPALRNRFTEIWVPAMSDIQDTIQIVEAKLIPEVRSYAKGMVAFAQWFKSNFDTSATTEISIRDILAWSSFVNAFANADAPTAVVHGAAMVYVDTLGANPAGLMTLAGGSLESERLRCVKSLAERTQTPAQQIYQQALPLSSTDESLAIGPFAIKRKTCDAAYDSLFSFEAPTTKSNAMRVMRAMQLSKPVMLEGSPGVGKTALVTAIAASAGVPLVRINLSDQTDLMDLFGSDAPVEDAEAGTFSWRDAPFLRTMKDGGWVLLDEMNLASQSVLEGLNAVLDHRGEVFIPEIGQTFAKHPEFRLFAAQNPHHQGGGRKGLPASFVNRFTVVFADAFKTEDLMLICSKSFSKVPGETIAQAVDFVHRLDSEVVQNKRFGTHGAPWEFNLRDITKWLALVDSEEGLLGAGNARDQVNMIFRQRFRTLGDRASIDETFGFVFDSSIRLADLSVSVSESVLQVGLGLLPRDPIESIPCASPGWRPQSIDDLGILQSLAICVQHRWPVLLTGPSGAGKSAIIEHLASIVGMPVEAFAMNAETDAIDLIGGYEQTDAYREAVQLLDDLYGQLAGMAKTSLAQDHSSDHVNLVADLRRELTSFKSAPCSSTSLQQLLSNVALPGSEKLQDAIKRATSIIDKARFSWVDGILVDALQQGKWLVLDNANLCSPSVLDRLNSLLENDGSLIINEHTESDGSPRVIRPHPKFRIFLVADPRYGELSRAMRNRAVELCMLGMQNQGPLLEQLTSESRLHQFRRAQVCQSISTSETAPYRLAQTLIDHLSVSDDTVAPRFFLQLQRGLYGGLPQVQPWLIAQSQSAKGRRIPKDLEPLKVLYASAVSRRQLHADFANVQTLHPLINQPLVQQEADIFALSLHAGFTRDASWLLADLLEQTITYQTNRAIVSRLIRVERQLFPGLSTRRKSDHSLCLAAVEQCARGLNDWLSGLDDLQLIAWSKLKAQLRVFLCGLQLLLATLSHENLDTCSLSVCLSAIREANSHTGPVRSDDYGLGMEIGRPLFALSEKPSNNWGSECTTLWKSLKSPLPGSAEQLQRLLEFENLVSQFDQIAFEFDQPLDSLISLRSSFGRALRLAQAGDDNLDELTDELRSIVKFPTDRNRETSSAIPHFTSSFRRILRDLSIVNINSPSTTTPNFLQKLALLALRPTDSSDSEHSSSQSPTLGSQFALLGMVQNSDSSADNGDVFQTIWQDSRSAKQVKIQQMPLLRSEIEVLSNAIFGSVQFANKEVLEALDHHLGGLTKGVLQALFETSSSETTRHLADELLCQLSPAQLRTSATKTSGLASSETSSELLTITLQHINAVYNRAADRLQGASRAWTAFGCACLRLYLPSDPFDPALESFMKLDVHDRCQKDLNSELEALSIFRKRLTGETSTLRLRLLESEFAAYAPRPEEPAVYRPSQSQISQILLDFDSLKQITGNLERTILHDITFSDATNQVANLRQLRSRLANNYRAYTDFTEPVVYFVDCLTTAAQLSQQAMQTTVDQKSSRSIKELIPFVHGQLNLWLSDRAFAGVLTAGCTPNQRLSWLSTLVVRSSICPLPDTSSDLQDTIEEQFARFHEQWRRELTLDQKQHSAKTSLYKYKGDPDLDEEVAAQELADLFPSYEGGMGDALATDPPNARIQNSSSAIAEVHRSLYSRRKPTDQDILDLLHRASEQPLSPSESQQQESVKPMTLLLVHELHAGLHTGLSSKKLYDIYKDSNCGEVGRLRQIVQSIKSRFNELHSTWPEHATPLQVVQMCVHISSYGHTEPLMRILPSVEKLHTTMTDWEKVASREYSVDALMGAIVDLIIGWRRLELSSWASLYNQEDRRCDDEAASWWFVAYQTLIVGTASWTESLGSATEYIVALLGTLQSFIQDCGLGEYRSRLTMLRSFEAHLSTRSQQGPMAERVHQALDNFILYFARFEHKVVDALAKGRQDVEKEIKNVIQLASWKDRNIDTLRQSAKASHKKLARLVRKYRNLLAQPVTLIVQAGIPGEVRSESDLARVPFESHGNPITSMEIPDRLTAWNSRPVRYHNIQSTLHLMQAKLDTMESAKSSSERLTSFMLDLSESMKELRKATPRIRKDSNEALINHLKTRKRRLLADVLKALRTMGWQSNLTEDILKRQAGLPQALVLMASRASNALTPVTSIAEHDLHCLLGLMPTARESSRKHSDELTQAETARCIAFLEGIVNVAIQQHNSLSEYEAQNRQLRHLICKMHAFSRTETPTVNAPAQSTYQSTDLHFIAVVISSCARLVRMQATITGRDFSTVLVELDNVASQCEQTASEYSTKPELPNNILSVPEIEKHAATAGILDALQSAVRTIAHQHPELEYLLEHLPRWIPSGTAHSKVLISNHNTDSSTWISMLLRFLDGMLTIVQTIDSSGGLKLTAEDENAWLRQDQKALETMWTAFTVEEISAQIAALLSNLERLDDHDETLPALAAVCHNVLPLIQSYQAAVEKLVVAYGSLHKETCRFGHTLATSFITLAREGFCSPPDKTEDDKGKEGNVEGGTGLGEGEGAEDISKDVGADEDLSELAQGAKEKGEEEEIEDEKDAVDMADDELEGELGEAAEGSEDGDQSGEETPDDKDIEEETGKVGEDDANAIDEKMWDDGKVEESQDKEGSSGKGTSAEDEVAASTEKDKDQDKEEDTGQKGQDEVEEDVMEADAEENVERPDMEEANPHMQEQENLDLPDDLNLEGEPAVEDEGLDPDMELDEMSEQGGDNEQQPGDPEEVAETSLSDASSQDGETTHEAGEDADESTTDAMDDEQLLQNQDESLDQPGSPIEGAVAGEQGSGQDNSVDQLQSATSANAAEEDELQDEAAAEQQQQSTGTQGGMDKGQSSEAAKETSDGSIPDQPSAQFKQLGDVLEQWYKQHRVIEAPDPSQNSENQQQQQEDVDMAGARFEHLADNETAAETQALGTGSAEQSTALNEDTSLPVREDEAMEDLPFQRENDESEMETEHDNEEPHADPSDNLFPDQSAKVFVGGQGRDGDIDMEDYQPADDSEDVDDVDLQLTNTHISNEEGIQEMSIGEARQQWAQHESNTRNLSLILTEQLRLILHPTQATKMRGDFRTGKRLNIKKIIPYIASSYKRDKIWMRRSVPSKRAYQIMLAIDDSKSMAESGSGALAFETLALVAKSLSMLEVGELCVLSFGEGTKVTHDFSAPFTGDAGPDVFRQFTFAQARTNVRRLLDESLELFRAARLRALGAASELWQLQLIISDGVCEDHAGIRQLVRAASEERVMIVFIVIDAAATVVGFNDTDGDGKHSILDLQTAEFTQDAAGEMQLKMVKYLDTFPFRYYLIVRDVQELPGVLAGALRQWFTEVVESGSS